MNDDATDLFDVAAARGIIDETQRDRLRALESELRASRHDGVAERRPRTVEARRGVNAVTVAYATGALLVVFALGWFLVDRWRSLGPYGALAVSVGYAVAFAAVTRVLGRRGFRAASGIAATLAVSMTPVWTFAILRIAGAWPPQGSVGDALIAYRPWLATRWMILELATIGVALVVTRRARFLVMGLPIAVAFTLLLLHTGEALGNPETAWYTGPYYQALIAAVVLAVAYLIDRRQPPGDDYALWFHIAGVVLLFIAYLQLWRFLGPWRHALPLVAAALVVASVYLRRRALLIGGGVAAVGYLAYLAFDVFEDTIALPVALAGLGLLVIVATVYAQRRFPALVARVSETEGRGPKRLPAHLISVAGPVLIAMAALWSASVEARERTAERDFRNEIYRRRAMHPDMRPRGGPAPGRPLPPPRPASDSADSARAATRR